MCRSKLLAGHIHPRSEEHEDTFKGSWSATRFHLFI